MKTLNSVSQTIPIFMLTMYLALFLCIDSLYYASIYDTIIVTVDTILMVLSIIGLVVFYKTWTKLAILSFISVVILNILTEIANRCTLGCYYYLYGATFIIFGISVAVFYKKQ